MGQILGFVTATLVVSQVQLPAPHINVPHEEHPSQLLCGREYVKERLSMVHVLVQMSLRVHFTLLARLQHLTQSPELLQVEEALEEIEDAVLHAREELSALPSLSSCLHAIMPRVTICVMDETSTVCK